MTQRRIKVAFETAIAAWATSQGLPINFQNAPDTIGNADTYGVVYILPAPTVNQTLGGEHRSYRGVVQVSLITKQGEGAGPLTALADSLEAAFPVNRRITQDGLAVLVGTPVSIAPGIPAPDRYTVPVSFTYRSDIVLPI